MEVVQASACVKIEQAFRHFPPIYLFYFFIYLSVSILLIAIHLSIRLSIYSSVYPSILMSIRLSVDNSYVRDLLVDGDVKILHLIGNIICY